MKQFKNFIGIDISKDTLDICLLRGNGETVFFKWENNIAVISEQLGYLYQTYELDKQDTLVCAESTGHFGNKLINVCGTEKLNLWVEQAYNILRSQGLARNKNDKLDAQRIAEYGKRFNDRARLYIPDNHNVKLLERLNSERDLIVKDIAKYRGQLKQEAGFFDESYFKEKKKRLQKLIKYNQKILLEVEKRIDQVIESDEQIKNNVEKMTSIEGIGPRTAVATIIATGNFTKFDNPRKFACHAGCAPFRQQSGSSLNSRNKVSQRANKYLKKTFHMAALSVVSSKGELGRYFERKVAEGKNKMTVINAIRSKLIHRIFAVVKQNRKYEKNYINTLA
ncbi:IS110 family transposase [Chondrinema litorale]|uniref:IS110 family transposase n=1 Tax=Chondrinema litorale TaxID=2994555 RepID=UPI002543D245|nr:IS110 family transposase [Chondrinema litorale]UZR99657.1 IS110 family transposase [Chondrinema litorale]